jgi:hypothetical protein
LRLGSPVGSRCVRGSILKTERPLRQLRSINVVTRPQGKPLMAAPLSPAVVGSFTGPDSPSSPPASTAAIGGISCRSPSLGQDFPLPEADQLRGAHRARDRRQNGIDFSARLNSRDAVNLRTARKDPGTAALPAALATAQRTGCYGRLFLAAVAAGYEVMERMATLCARAGHAQRIARRGDGSARRAGWRDGVGRRGRLLPRRCRAEHRSHAW